MFWRTLSRYVPCARLGWELFLPVGGVLAELPLLWRSASFVPPLPSRFSKYVSFCVPMERRKWSKRPRLPERMRPAAQNSRPQNRMKVAFVNQPIDTILPPKQNSVGACTYGVVPFLARSCEVVVYGSQDSHEQYGAQFSEHGVRYKFFSSTRADRLIFQARKKYSLLAPSAAPIST